MGSRRCDIDECDRVHYGRGLCQMHYQRARWRDAHEGARSYQKGPYEERLFARIDATGDCWEWTGFKTPFGYGVMKYNNQNRYAHRRVWEHLVGPIGEGLELDHLCKNRGCVNPDHLDPVTHAENTRRSAASAAMTAANTGRPRRKVNS
jgi:hypothetical protein